MPADRILECPFCGCNIPYRRYEGVACPECGANGPQDFREDKAIELWNRRTGTVYNGKTAEEWYRCIESISSFLTQCETKAAKDMQIAVETLDGEGYSDALGKQEAFSSIMLMLSDVLAPSPAKP